MVRSLSQSSCDRARELMSPELDNELSRPSALRLRAHTAVCGECRRYRRELHSITTILRHDRLPRRAALTLQRTVAGFAVVLVAVSGAVVATSSGDHGPAYRGGALPATQGLPVYDTSVSRMPH
jgi:hypothetical protein